MKALFALAIAWVTVAEALLDRPPLGLDLYMPVSTSNPITREKITLGRRLFFDRRLSRDGSLSCSSCHDPKRSFSDGRAFARGIHNAEGTRNSPALINRGYGSAFFWDGRALSLEQQVIEPITNPKELGNTIPEVERRTGMRAADITAALASYIRTIRSGNSRFDRYAAGQTGALNTIEQEGLKVFRGKGGCTACHIGPNFTDERFHNTGVAWRDGRLADEGRFAVSEVERDRGAFKTPTLRDLTRTAPYMHDGSLATLDDVIEFYSLGGRPNPYLDSAITPRNFSVQEKIALRSFLQTLTGRIQEESRR
jgi:cytochrome c peroxidase